MPTLLVSRSAIDSFPSKTIARFQYRTVTPVLDQLIICFHLHHVWTDGSDWYVSQSSCMLVPQRCAAAGDEENHL